MTTTTAYRAELQRRMTAQRLSQGQLADRADCSRSYICRLLKGERSPSPEMIDRIGVALGMSDQEVFHWILTIAIPERLHMFIRSDRVVAMSDLMTKLEQVGIGGRAA